MVHIVPSMFGGVFLEKNTRLPILLVPKPTYQNPGEGRETKARKRRSLAVGNRKSRASVLSGTPVDGEYEAGEV